MEMQISTKEILTLSLLSLRNCSLEGLKGSKDGDKHEREPSKEQTPWEQKYKITQVMSDNGCEKTSGSFPNQADETQTHAQGLPKTILLSGDLQTLDVTVKSMMETSKICFKVEIGTN